MPWCRCCRVHPGSSRRSASATAVDSQSRGAQGFERVAASGDEEGLVGKRGIGDALAQFADENPARHGVLHVRGGGVHADTPCLGDEEQADEKKDGQQCRQAEDAPPLHATFPPGWEV